MEINEMGGGESDDAQASLMGGTISCVNGYHKGQHLSQHLSASWLSASPEVHQHRESRRSTRIVLKDGVLAVLYGEASTDLTL